MPMLCESNFKYLLELWVFERVCFRNNLTLLVREGGKPKKCENVVNVIFAKFVNILFILMKNQRGNITFSD